MNQGNCTMMGELAKRTVACKGWRWLPGMLAQTPEGTRVGRIVERIRTGGVRMAGGGNVGWRCVPDLTDPPTLGGLLSLVREAWDCPYLSVVGTAEDWRIDAMDGPIGVRDLHSYTSEAAALVAALEAAP